MPIGRYLRAGSGRPNVRRFTCAAEAHVPKPTRHGRCRGGRAKTQAAICNGRVAMALVS